MSLILARARLVGIYLQVKGEPFLTLRGKTIMSDLTYSGALYAAPFPQERYCCIARVVVRLAHARHWLIWRTAQVPRYHAGLKEVL